jgi:hypothetical protein
MHLITIALFQFVIDVSISIIFCVSIGLFQVFRWGALVFSMISFAMLWMSPFIDALISIFILMKYLNLIYLISCQKMARQMLVIDMMIILKKWFNFIGMHLL